jgi:hypothetical protein
MTTAERLEKLLRMLSSDKDGEVVNAVRAIGRALQASGDDWHGLARRLSAPAKAQTAEQPRQNTDWRAMREFCMQHDSRLRKNEHEFLDNIAGWRGDLTEKQEAWLVAIYHRLGGTSNK